MIYYYCQGDDRDEVPENENEKKMAPFLSPFPQQIKILKKLLDKQLNIGYNKIIENNKHSNSER